ncbi:hypothetical protein GCM10011531_15020 [Aquaticitalea lipolytica]|uniref:Intradiol ring-cleavage dioxygenases domain-containing protein n=2 Tax=Aquaticitalea lipolytica TaxID=1247562 RepID=A0A8J2TQA9_9FLAO|nr:hypothetical protein GCM10011531_15020 [Aquaticitalea lipolytica]
MSVNFTLIAQETTIASNDLPADYLKRSALYDYSESQLNNTDSIPDFESKSNKLKITGTIYLSDGKTPAKDVILYIEQPDENGDYELKTENNKRYVHHRGWIKTNADGQYTFYTFIPGQVLRYKELKHIHPVIKAPGQPEYDMDALLFDNDPFLSKSCRKRLAKRGIDTILKPIMKDNLLVATRDIVLQQ